MGIRRNWQYWLPEGLGYPAANDKNIKMLLDALREVYVHHEPLTISELSDLYSSLEDKTILQLARAIERAHGIDFDNFVDDSNRHHYEIGET